MNTIIEKVIFLQKVNLFSDIPSEQLSHLAAIAERISVPEDTYLFEEGDPSEYLFIVISGAVEIRKDEKILKVSERYGEVGMLGFFDNAPRMGDALTNRHTELLRIQSVDFMDLLEDRVHLSHGILKFFVRHLRSLFSALEEKSEEIES